MDELTFGFLLFFGLLLGFLAGGLWIFAAMFSAGIVALWVYSGFSIDRIGLLLQATTWKSARAWELSAIPLFIWMGEILIRTDIASALFRAIAPLTRRIPGGLLHTNVLGCTLFAAVSGSTAATTATIGKITLPELARYGYPKGLSVGSLAGAGSIGILVPPSIPLIVYGVLAQVSISDLFLAGLVPGLLVAALYSGYIFVRSRFSADLRRLSITDSDMPGRDRLSILTDIIPFVLIVAIIFGGIYSGIATPSEAAALGVAATLLLVLARGQMSIRLVAETLFSTVRTSCMIAILLVSAGFLSSAMSFMHIPQAAGEAIAALNLSPFTLIIALTLFYLLLGCVLDGVSMMVMTLPITLPLVVGAGFDPIWLGVFLVLTMEMGLVTPPIGFNLFVIRAISQVTIGQIAYAALPFFFLLGLAVLLITVFPAIVLFLPSQL